MERKTDRNKQHINIWPFAGHEHMWHSLQASISFGIIYQSMDMFSQAKPMPNTSTSTHKHPQNGHGATGTDKNNNNNNNAEKMYNNGKLRLNNAEKSATK